MLSLGAGTATRLTLTAIGIDGAEAVDALARLLNSLDAPCHDAAGASKDVLLAVHPVG